MKKVIITLALVVGLAVVGLVGHHVTKQADGTTSTAITTITDPGDGSGR